MKQRHRRLHGRRSAGRSLRQGTFQPISGRPEEVWSCGEEAYAILRERLRPILHALAESAHGTGAPAMRPLFFEFPEDEDAWNVDDQFLIGADLLVAPVEEAGARSRFVYLPRGAHWIDAASGQLHEGGWTVEVATPPEHIPVFVRAGSALIDVHLY